MTHGGPRQPAVPARRVLVIDHGHLPATRASGHQRRILTPSGRRFAGGVTAV